MENIQSLMANLTDEQVTEYQAAKYPPSIRDWAKQEQEARVLRRNQAQEALNNQIVEEQNRIAFIKKIANLPQPPQGVYNVYLSWQEVEIEDKEHPEEVEVPKLGENGQPIMTSKGNQVVVKEVRYPKTKKYAWVVGTNKGFQVAKSTSSGKSESTTKRAITVSKRSATNANQLELVGHFRSANEACTHLKVEVGKDSATRVLQREGMFTEPYDGVDFTFAK